MAKGTEVTTVTGEEVVRPYKDPKKDLEAFYDERTKALNRKDLEQKLYDLIYGSSETFDASKPGGLSQGMAETLCESDYKSLYQKDRQKALMIDELIRRLIENKDFQRYCVQRNCSVNTIGGQWSFRIQNDVPVASMTRGKDAEIFYLNDVRYEEIESTTQNKLDSLKREFHRMNLVGVLEHFTKDISFEERKNYLKKDPTEWSMLKTWYQLLYDEELKDGPETYRGTAEENTAWVCALGITLGQMEMPEWVEDRLRKNGYEPEEVARADMFDLEDQLIKYGESVAELEIEKAPLIQLPTAKVALESSLEMTVNPADETPRATFSDGKYYLGDTELDSSNETVYFSDELKVVDPRLPRQKTERRIHHMGDGIANGPGHIATYTRETSPYGEVFLYDYEGYDGLYHDGQRDGFGRMQIVKVGPRIENKDGSVHYRGDSQIYEYNGFFQNGEFRSGMITYKRFEDGKEDGSIITIKETFLVQIGDDGIPFGTMTYQAFEGNNTSLPRKVPLNPDGSGDLGNKHFTWNSGRKCFDITEKDKD